MQAANPRRMPVKLTRAIIAKLNSTRGERPEIFWDSELKGFGVLVSGKTRVKSYVVQYGRIPRRTVGRCDLVPLDQARRDAIELLGHMVKGIDPKRTKKEIEAAEQRATEAAAKSDISLKQIFDAFCKSRKDLRPVSVRGYEQLLTNHLGDWMDRPLREITRDAVETRHVKISKDVKERNRSRLTKGFHSANATMRVVRILWNYALAKEMIPGLGTNPVTMLSKVKAWYPEHRRETIIPPQHLPFFFAVVTCLRNHILRDLILLMVFTGLRVGEATTLEWDDVDFDEGLIRLRAGKTKTGRKLDLPMSEQVRALLTQRRLECQAGKWVFPGNGAEGHAKNPKSALQRVCRQAELPYYGPHDLRRTFITVAESCEISVYALKALVNHSVGSDVTAGYIQMGPERLRAAAQRAADRLTQLAFPEGAMPDFIQNRALAS